VAIDVRIAEGWVFYGPDPGEIAQPAVISVRAEGLEVGSVLWPPDHPKTTDLGRRKVTNNVYEHRAVAYVPISVPKGAPLGSYRIEVSARGQICDVVKGTCIPVNRSATVRFDVAASWAVNPDWGGDGEIAGGLGLAKTTEQLSKRTAHGAAAPAPGPSPRAPQLTLISGLGLALLAGLILNVMPCVLPVIPLRIVSIVQMATGSRRRFVTLGLAFAGGIMLFFAALGTVNIILHLVTDRAFNWSEHFQSPGVRIALALLIVALAANLFGLFTVTVPRRVAGIEAGADRRKGHLGTVGMGLMMAILATPCSFAILALALAWAQLQPLWLGTLTILLIGVGMASPHALLTAAPNLLSVLPKPGVWMEKLKQTMGFVLLPVAVWLIGTLTSDSYVVWVIAYAVVVVFGLWIWGTWVRYDAPLRRKVIVRGPAVAMVVLAGWWMLRPPLPLAVQFDPFDAERIASAGRDDTPVLVKFTASWCLSCKWVDAAIYDDPAVAQQLTERGVVAMKGDVTNRSSPASKFLAANFGGAPPLTVIYASGARSPILLEGKFSKAELTEALGAATDPG
ncbi:MAG: thioredoxin family protein, partial [Phycisphaerae bacterium]|nr:thioredoxin family protein [Phycisphaerae bacterium]